LYPLCTSIILSQWGIKEKSSFLLPQALTVLPIMTMVIGPTLKFCVDQVQQLAFPLFQAVLKQEGSRKRLWQHMRALFYTLEFAALEDIFRALLYGYKVEGVVIFGPA
jgi:hypothetical protein